MAGNQKSRIVKQGVSLRRERVEVPDDEYDEPMPSRSAIGADSDCTPNYIAAQYRLNSLDDAIRALSNALSDYEGTGCDPHPGDPEETLPAGPFLQALPGMLDARADIVYQLRCRLDNLFRQ